MSIRTLGLLLIVAVALSGLHGAAHAADAPAKSALPRLVDLGAGECIPCRKMAPIIDELQKELAGKLDVAFIDVWKDPDAGDKYAIKLIPTQIFYSAAGKELFRHEGFFSREDILAKWHEFGVELGGAPAAVFSRWEPARPDARVRSAICYLCDGDIGTKARVVVRTEKGDVHLCSMHHFFVMISCLAAETSTTEAQASVADWASAVMTPVQSAVYLCGLDEKTGRPVIKAFVDRDAALAERAAAGGNLLDYATLRDKELAVRCGFCDRSVYPEDAASVRVGGLYTWGCCSHCAMGVAARTAGDIEVHERDRLTGEPIVVRTLDRSVSSVEPPTAVAWFGQRTKPDGTRVSAGCFHQGFFVSPENLREWVDANPLETGEMITINKALADKLALSPEQIQKACKIGECAPK
jgi:thioredoxin 1